MHRSVPVQVSTVIVTNSCGENRFKCSIAIPIPGDPAYSTPDVSNFIFFLGEPSGILCATVYFFPEISGPF
jgi:hypothetical protein